MIELSAGEIAQIYQFQKRLQKLNDFSYGSYAELKIINFKLQAYLKTAITANDQLLLSLSFEIANEIEDVLQLRFADNKNEALGIHVKTTLMILQKLIKNLPEHAMPVNDEPVPFLNRLKLFFKSSIR